jgi:hypothetical protein
MVREAVEFLGQNVFLPRPEPIIRHVEAEKAFQQVAKKQRQQRFLGLVNF